jgi:hypothetical protein
MLFGREAERAEMAQKKRNRGGRTKQGPSPNSSKPKRNQGVPRSLGEKIDALDDHLYLLRINLEDHSGGETAHLRVIAAELRTLVCLSSETDGLIWRLARELGVSDLVGLDLSPVVGQLDNYNILAYIPLQFASDLPSPSLDFLVRADYHLEDVIKHRVAVHVNGQPMTFDAVIKHCAQQIDTAHEGDNVDPSLDMARRFFIANRGLHAEILCRLAKAALIVGDRVIDRAVRDRSYQLKPRRRSAARPGQS